jgi:energy-coupling factor transporter ATP-binding protein EcfA2
MTDRREFPPELLKAPPSERLQYFKGFTMAHPRLVAMKDRLLTAIRDAGPGTLIFVYGPTGVGKTTLRLRVEQLLAQEMLSTFETDPGRFPSVSVEAVAPEHGNFHWKDHFRLMLEVMKEPLISHKLSNFHQNQRDVEGQFANRGNAVGACLRHAVEQALLHRRPTAVFIDEAQHLAKMASGRKLLDQLDVVKSTANRTGTTHVLLGTYDLLFFRNLSGQLSRRSVDAHFPRYQSEDHNDVAVFQDILLTFQHHIPLPEVVELTEMWDFMYERSIGCVGLLKDWLTRTLAAVFREGGQSLARKHLETTALSAVQCENILAETREGEAIILQDEDCRQRLRRSLGLDSAAVPSQPADQPDVHESRRRRRGRVGQRTPTRDPVGVRAAANA